MAKPKIPFKHIFKVIKLLDTKDKRNLVIVMFGALLMGVIEVIGVSSIMPFIAVASNPDLIETNRYLNWVYVFFQFNSYRSFLIVLGSIMLSFVIIRNAFSAFLMYIQLRFVQGCRHRLSMRLFRYYLGQEYEYFLSQNSYVFGKNILGEVIQIINGTVMQMVSVLTYAIQIFLLGLFLFLVDPISTLVIFCLISFVYTLVFNATKKEVSRLGAERFVLNTELNKTVGEAFAGIKDVKISGNENLFYNNFLPNSSKLSNNAASESVIGILPKYALEATGFSAIILFVMVTILRSPEGFSSAITSISMYAYAGYRLLPVVQNIFRSITALRYSQKGTELMMTEFDLGKTAMPLSENSEPRMPFLHNITLNNIVFMYKNKNKPVLNSISLEIKANSLVGFCGTTGSGKTTTIDVILGLLKPQSGDLKIDNSIVTSENVHSWQKNIGYVPQTIYLSDSTIVENIAFGVPKEQVDMAAVKRAAEMAQISDFIETEFENSYESRIGERGVQLSGGQRQRIGIARALYRNPSLLVMDEATSALDNETEAAVMSAIENLSGKKTIILIAHRLSTLQKCDCIYKIEKGVITESGTYVDLFKGE